MISIWLSSIALLAITLTLPGSKAFRVMRPDLKTSAIRSSITEYSTGLIMSSWRSLSSRVVVNDRTLTDDALRSALSFCLLANSGVPVSIMGVVGRFFFFGEVKYDWLAWHSLFPAI